jgi:hypothetical protein
MYLGLMENNSSLIFYASDDKKEIISKYKEKLIKIDKNRKMGYKICEESCNLALYELTEKVDEIIVKIGKDNELKLLILEETSIDIRKKISSHANKLNYIKFKNKKLFTKIIQDENYSYLSINKLIDENSISINKTIIPKVIFDSKIKMDFYENLKPLNSIDNVENYFYDRSEKEINIAVENNTNVTFGSGYMIIKNKRGEEIIPFKNISNISTCIIENGLIVKNDEFFNFNKINTVILSIFINNKEIELVVFPDLYKKIRGKFISKIKNF